MLTELGSCDALATSNSPPTALASSNEPPTALVSCDAQCSPLSGVVPSASWKGLELKCNPLHEILIVQHGQGCIFWDLEIFHNHLRRMRATKWLRKMHGASRIQKVGQILYPHLDYRWIPSLPMLTALGSENCKLPGVSGSGKMAPLSWLLSRGSSSTCCPPTPCE